MELVRGKHKKITYTNLSLRNITHVSSKCNKAKVFSLIQEENTNSKIIFFAYFCPLFFSITLYKRIVQQWYVTVVKGWGGEEIQSAVDSIM